MICSNCGTSNPAGRRFCDNCGSALSSACPNCGEQNRPGARFCGNCGTALTATTGATTAPDAAQAVRSAERSERRLVSVLFADLVGFTPFAEERDPEEVRNTLSRYFDAARTVIERHGGTVEKFIGDAVMAVWGTPQAREDDAERAVRAALELLPAVRSVEANLQARAGVATGETAVSLDARQEGMVAGDLVNTAARLQSVAAPATVLVDEATMRASSAAVAFEAAGEQDLKGKAARLPAWRALRVLGERGGRARSEQLEPPFVGREAELNLLKELIHAAGTERRARLVAVTGPAGIGKSRLAWELEKYLDGLVETIYWHRGRSPSYGEGVTFWALGEMVRRRARLAETDDEGTTRQRISETVAEYVPAEDDRQLVEPALRALLGVGEPPAGGREVLFAAWRIFFERIAEMGTTVLLFEDLQWADSGLLDFIDHLLEWSRAFPLVVLALARPELTEKRPTFGSATRHFHSIPLEPLTAEQMRELLNGLVPGLPPEAVEVSVGRADGIPLYAVETVRMLLADRRLEAVGDGTFRPTGELGRLAIPETLRSLVASRLDALDDQDRSLLQHASVLGQTFALETLAAIGGLAGDELTPRLRGLVRRELLALEADPRSPERGQYTFVQGLIREVAYGTLSRRERRERHLAAARHFEAEGDEEIAGALASHYLAAHGASEAGPEADAVAAQARLALRAAADRASSLGSYAQALAYLEQALEVTPDPADRAPSLERAAHAADFAGRYDRGIELAAEAIEAYGSAGDLVGAAKAARLRGMILMDAGRLHDAADILEAAISSLPAGNPEAEAALYASLSRAYMRLYDNDRAVEAADRALPIAEHRRMVDIVAEAFSNKGSAFASMGRWREAAALLAAAAEHAQAAGNMELHVRARNNLAVALGDEDPWRAQTIVAEALELARRLGLRSMTNWFTTGHAFHSWWRASNWDETLTLLADALEDAASDTDRQRLRLMEILLRASRGEQPEGATEFLESLAKSADDPAHRGPAHGLQGMLAFARNDLGAAYEMFARAQDIFDQDTPALEWGTRCGFWLGDRQRAAWFVERLERMPHSGRSFLCLRTWARAGMAALEGAHDEALTGFVEAIRVRQEMRLELLAACFVLDALIMLPDRPELMPFVDQAHAVFERVGARPYLNRLAEATRGAGVPSEAGTAVS